MKKTKGFTLIELLVVISIIALLLSILLPSLSIAKKKAKSLICRTNLRSMSLASSLYMSSNNDKMIEYFKENGDLADYLWIDKITEYCDNVEEAKYCPSTKPNNQPRFGTAKESWEWPAPDGEVFQGSYAINGWFYSYPGGWPDYCKYKQFGHDELTYTSSRASSLAPFFADAVWVDVWPVDNEFCRDALNLDGTDIRYNRLTPWPSTNNGWTWHNPERLLTDRHGPRTNISFFDGHVDQIPLDMVWTLKWNAKFTNQGKMTRQPSGGPVYRK